MEQLIEAVVSGLLGGIVTGVAAIATMRTELRWLRADLNRHEQIINTHFGVQPHEHARSTDTAA